MSKSSVSGVSEIVFPSEPTAVSVRCTQSQKEQIQRAADKSGQNVSDWARYILTQHAASDLGESPAIDLSKRESTRPPSSITQAAAKLGIDRDQFRQMAAEMFAEMALAGRYSLTRK